MDFRGQAASSAPRVAPLGGILTHHCHAYRQTSLSPAQFALLLFSIALPTFLPPPLALSIPPARGQRPTSTLTPLFPSDPLFQFVLGRAIIELLLGVSHKGNFPRLKEPHEAEINIGVTHPGCGWEEVQGSCLNLCLLAPVSQILPLLRGQIKHEFKSWLDWGIARASRAR